MTRPNDNHSPGEVNLATESSVVSAKEMRESESEFQSLVVWGKKMLL